MPNGMDAAASIEGPEQAQPLAPALLFSETYEFPTDSFPLMHDHVDAEGPWTDEVSDAAVSGTRRRLLL